MPPTAARVLSPFVPSAGATDDAVIMALVSAEVALVRAWIRVGLAPSSVGEQVDQVWGWDATARRCTRHSLDRAALATSLAQHGNPVIGLVEQMRSALGADAAAWVHRGATSQDILDTALMIVTRDVTREAGTALTAVEANLTALAVANRDVTAVARTLTQHAVPTTAGARVAGWVRGIARARARLAHAGEALPVQLGGAAGTLASFVEVARTQQGATASPEDVVRHLVAAFADELGLTAPAAPWHTVRADVTEPGDALVQVCDALAKFGADVATLSRTEIAEVSVSSAGGSSAMPHKRNPVAAVALRSAGMRAPMLGATLHVASASAVDERPDGAWHAEWPTLQDLLELALGACGTAVELSQSLTINLKEIAANLELSRGAILSERLSIALPPLVGPEVTTAAVRVASEGGDLAGFLTSQAKLPGAVVAEITDLTNATGLATWLVDTLPTAERP